LCEGYLQHVSKKGYRITGAGRKHLNAMRLHLRAERERQWSLPV
jgi:DNA-binding PadR family transcriptional regulator